MRYSLRLGLGKFRYTSHIQERSSKRDHPGASGCRIPPLTEGQLANLPLPTVPRYLPAPIAIATVVTEEQPSSSEPVVLPPGDADVVVVDAPVPYGPLVAPVPHGPLVAPDAMYNHTTGFYYADGGFFRCNPDGSPIKGSDNLIILRSEDESAVRTAHFLLTCNELKMNEIIWPLQLIDVNLRWPKP